MALLIVNADDYGLTEATSHSILRCHQHGIVTSTSVLVLAPGFILTARHLEDSPDLGVGVHLAIVGEDPPLLSAREIPTLVDNQGHLATSWRHLLPQLIRRRIDPADVERELTAQVDLALTSCVRLTHLDSHQHLHQWPSFWPIVTRLARRAGVDAIRTTRDGRWGALSTLGRITALRARRAGLRTPDHFAGFTDSGHLNEANLTRLVDGLPRVGSVEIGCHPGAMEDPERHRYRWGFEWGAEEAALTGKTVRNRLESLGHRLGNYDHLR